MFLPVPQLLAQHPAALAASGQGGVVMGMTLYALSMLALTAWDKHVLPRFAH